MNNFETKETIKFLENIHQKATRLTNRYNNGKNKSIKKNAYEDLKMEIELFRRQIENGKVPLDLFVPKIDDSLIRSEFYDDLFSVSYFAEEIENALRKLKNNPE